MAVWRHKGTMICLLGPDCNYNPKQKHTSLVFLETFPWNNMVHWMWYLSLSLHKPERNGEGDVRECWRLLYFKLKHPL